MYECIVCLEIKLEPKACIECGAIVCKECTEDIQKCPECEDEKSKLQPNRVLKKFIAQLKMPCDKCGQVLDFADHQTHKEKCSTP